MIYLPLWELHALSLPIYALGGTKNNLNGTLQLDQQSNHVKLWLKALPLI